MIPTVDEIARRLAAEVVGGQLLEAEISDIAAVLTEAKASWEKAQREPYEKILEALIKLSYKQIAGVDPAVREIISKARDILNAGKED